MDFSFGVPNILVWKTFPGFWSEGVGKETEKKNGEKKRLLRRVF